MFGSCYAWMLGTTLESSERTASVKTTESSLQPLLLLFIFKADNSMFLVHIDSGWMVCSQAN